MYNLSDSIRFQLKGGLKFQGSIAKFYLKNIDKNLKKGHVDFQLLKDIVDSYKRPQIKNAICIHMRLADACNFKCHKKQDVVQETLHIIDQYSLSKVYKKSLIFYKNHINKNERLSQQIIQNLIHHLKKRGINAEWIANDVDEDFISLSTAACYIPTFRGFSWLSASINPNKVFWEIQNPPDFDWVWSKDYIPALNEGYKFQKQLYNNT